MKRSTLLILSFFAVAVGYGQTKKDTAKARYDYFVKIRVQDYQQLIGIAGDYSKQVKYNPLMKSDDKVTVQINIEKYLFDLPKSVKLDSVKAIKK